MKKAIRRRGVPQEILSQLQLPLSELIRQTLLDTVITSGTIQAIEMPAVSAGGVVRAALQASCRS